MCNIDVTYQPRRVDWNVPTWTMTISLYELVGAVDAIEWECVLCSQHIENDWMSRATNLHQILDEVWTFLHGNHLDDSEGCSCQQLVIDSFITTTHPLMHHISCRDFWWNIKLPRWLSPSTSPDLVPGKFWVFPKLKSPLIGKRFQIINEIQENMTGQLMAMERSQWGPKVPTLKEAKVLLSYVQYFWYLFQ